VTIRTANARKGLFEMTDGQKSEGEAALLNHFVERVKLLEAELRTAGEVRKGRSRGKRKRTLRTLARHGTAEAVLIGIRNRLRRCHVRGGLDGIPVTARDLLEVHQEQSGLCRYTGLPYEFGSSGPLDVVVDRLDPGRGWDRENVVLCARFAAVARNGWPMSLVVPLWRFLPTRWDGCKGGRAPAERAVSDEKDGGAE